MRTICAQSAAAGSSAHAASLGDHRSRAGPCSQAWLRPPAGPYGARGAEGSPRPASLGHPWAGIKDEGYCGPPACARPELSVPRTSPLWLPTVTWVCSHLPCVRKAALVVMCCGWQKGGGPCRGMGWVSSLPSWEGGDPWEAGVPGLEGSSIRASTGELGPSWGCWATGQAQAGLNQALPTPALLGAWHKLLSLS